MFRTKTPRAAALRNWLLSTAFCLVAFGQTYPTLQEMYGLSQSNELAHGTVTAVSPANHDACEYRYVVRDKVYLHSGVDCGSFMTGQAITVYYSPADPGRSINAEPKGRFRNELASTLAALFGLPLLAAAFGYFARRKIDQLA